MNNGSRLSDLDAVLREIRDSAAMVEAFTSGGTEQQLLVNREKQDAVIRRIEVMGEAAARIMRSEPDFEKAFPTLPLKTIYAMPNRVIHGYDGVNLKTVWNTAIRDAPALRGAVGKLLADRQGRD